MPSRACRTWKSLGVKHKVLFSGNDASCHAVEVGPGLRPPSRATGDAAFPGCISVGGVRLLRVWATFNQRVVSSRLWSTDFFRNIGGCRKQIPQANLQLTLWRRGFGATPAVAGRPQGTPVAACSPLRCRFATISDATRSPTCVQRNKRHMSPQESATAS